MENNQNSQKKIDNKKMEKRISISLVITTLILVYIATFFIHDIVSLGGATDSQTVEIVYPSEEDKEIVNYTDRIIIKQGDKSWSELKELDIFRNSVFKDESKIAPGVQGSYSFTVESETQNAIIYDIKFREENPYSVNMVYKLKVNGEYVMGDAQSWGSYQLLERTKMNLKPHGTDLYTIEWKWEDTDRDTPIGQTDGSYYKMYIDVVTEQDLEHRVEVVR